MKSKTNYLKNELVHLKKLAKSNSVYDFAIIYGLLSSLLIFLKQVFSYFIMINDNTINITLYIVTIIFSFVLFINFIVIFLKRVPEKNTLASIYVKTYPFLVFILALLIISVYSDVTDRIISLVIMLVFISWIQIYRLPRRILIYSFVLITYFIYSFTQNGIGLSILRDNGIVLMFIFISFLTSTIIYQVFKNHNKALDSLNKKNTNFKTVIDRLKETHEELKQSKLITDAMYVLTQEVLKNENLEDILQLVLDKAIELIPNSQAGSILVLNQGKMNFVAAKGYKLSNLRKIELKPEELYQATLEDKYQPFIIKNLEVFDEVHIGKEKTERLKVESAVIAKSCLTCSFQYNGEFFGSINIDNFDSESIFTEKDKYQIKQLANELEIIISIHKLYEQAIRPTKFDDLTDAYTRKHCIQLLRRLIDKYTDESISIITIDINDLKQINDKYGHDTGDKFLKYFADAVRNTKIREHIFGRVGGDEFLLIFNKTNQKEAVSEIQKLRKYLEKNPFISNETQEKITFAAGISIYPTDEKSIPELIKLSDRRMYIDKGEQKK